MRLIRLVVGVLPQNHDADLFKRRQRQRLENPIRRRVYRLRPVFLFYKVIQLRIIRLFKLCPKRREPVILNGCHKTSPSSPRGNYLFFFKNMPKS